MKSLIKNKKPILNKRESDAKVRAEKRDINVLSVINGKRVIAIASLFEGAGSTHVSLAIAYCLSKDYDVALVECTNQELASLKGEYKCESGNLNSTRFDNLDIYFKGSNTLIEILKQPYKFIFLDLGKIDYSNQELMNEMYRADEKIVVTQLSEWKQRYLNKFLEKEIPLDGWTIITNLTSEENYKKLRKILKEELKRGNNNILQMPYTEDVFNYSGNITKLIKGEYRG